ncbi:glycosyl hydrolase family 61-domain-containing protein [Massariosphaeria phaeospora]|uniref:lytic cellulose monooxygenase (C4-dehydrogenating) n=1 Tax=Massariosphaeria phaeospora TaxID=100035 RepID=A0A7C8I6Z6_9PLEO|nr:glycosyl hydrolase family 61-domain-containing protein [Massariosphaeria phaeospora]
MKFSNLLVLSTAACLPGASAHYTFWSLVINQNVTGIGEYVRTPDRDRKSLWRYPAYLANGTLALACNTDTFASAPNTSIATVTAGLDLLGFQSASKKGKYGSLRPYPVWHPGPLGIYLSKSETPDVRDYDGSGKWFKIYELGWNASVPEGPVPYGDPVRWFAEETNTSSLLHFPIPPTTPPGQYLLRIEHIFPQTTVESMQLYISCAQIEVQGPGGGTPGPLVQISDYLNVENQDLAVSQEMEWDYKVDPGYKIPGPKVWTGESD